MKKLIEIQSALKAPKGQFNKFGNYSYRSCEDILEAVKPHLVEHKCSLIICDKIVNIGNRFYVEATATLTAEDGKQVAATAYARETESKKGMDAAQLTGATSSYARKYALNGLLCIDDTKDAEATSEHDRDEEPPKLPPVDMIKMATDEGIKFLKTKGDTPLEAIKWMKRTRTVTPENEKLIQELWKKNDNSR